MGFPRETMFFYTSTLICPTIRSKSDPNVRLHGGLQLMFQLLRLSLQVRCQQRSAIIAILGRTRQVRRSHGAAENTELGKGGQDAPGPGAPVVGKTEKKICEDLAFYGLEKRQMKCGKTLCQ